MIIMISKLCLNQKNPWGWMTWRWSKSSVMLFLIEGDPSYATECFLPNQKIINPVQSPNLTKYNASNYSLYGWVCQHKIFVIMLREVVWYYFKIIFAITRYTSAWSMFGWHHEGRGRTTHIYYWQNYYKKMHKYFSMIPFASSRLWSKIFLKFLSIMLDHLKGRGRATPNFNFENYYKKSNEYFSMIPGASSRLWSKIFF